MFLFKLYFETILLIFSMVVCFFFCFLFAYCIWPTEGFIFRFPWGYVFFLAFAVSISMFFWISTLFKVKIIHYISILVGAFIVDLLISFYYLGFAVGVELVLFSIYLFLKHGKKLKLISVLLIFFGVAVPFMMPTPRREEQKILQNLKQELHPGISQKDLISYLDEKKINHDGYDNRTHSLGATFFNIGGCQLIRKEYDVYFLFNKKNELTNLGGYEAPQGP